MLGLVLCKIHLRINFLVQSMNLRRHVHMSITANPGVRHAVMWLQIRSTEYFHKTFVLLRKEQGNWQIHSFLDFSVDQHDGYASRYIIYRTRLIKANFAEVIGYNILVVCTKSTIVLRASDIRMELVSCPDPFLRVGSGHETRMSKCVCYLWDHAPLFVVGDQFYCRHDQSFCLLCGE